jgi:hypothetical protein
MQPPSGGPPSADGGDACSTEGQMRCGRDGGFDTCDHGKWVYRACAAATACKPSGNSILCDHATPQ